MKLDRVFSILWILALLCVSSACNENEAALGGGTAGAGRTRPAGTTTEHKENASDTLDPAAVVVAEHADAVGDSIPENQGVAVVVAVKAANEKPDTAAPVDQDARTAVKEPEVAGTGVVAPAPAPAPESTLPAPAVLAPEPGPVVPPPNAAPVVPPPNPAPVVPPPNPAPAPTPASAPANDRPPVWLDTLPETSAYVDQGIHITARAADPDGDPIAYSILASACAAFFANANAPLAVDATGLITGAPSAVTPGGETCGATVRATANGVTIEQMLVVSIFSPRAPKYSCTSSASRLCLVEGESRALTCGAVHIPGDMVIRDGGEVTVRRGTPADGYQDGAGWSSIQTSVQGLNGTHRLSIANAGTSAAAEVTWRVDGLPPAQYDVFVRWISASDSSPNVQYRVYDGEILRKTRFVSQRIEPADETIAGYTWHKVIGPFPAASGSLKVVLSPPASSFGRMTADAILVRPVGSTHYYLVDDSSCVGDLEPMVSLWIDGRLQVENGGSVHANLLTGTATSLRIDQSSKISADELGFRGGAGGGNGPGNVEGASPGHGGVGYRWLCWNPTSRDFTCSDYSTPEYGDPAFPMFVGSAAADPTSHSKAGGILNLEIAGDAEVDGQLSADSRYGGTGGSLMLRAKHLLGFGAITATGGDFLRHTGYTPAGAGGRIKVTTEQDDFAGAIDAKGGFALEYHDGFDGSIQH